MQNTAGYSPITFKENVMVMINEEESVYEFFLLLEFLLLVRRLQPWQIKYKNSQQKLKRDFFLTLNKGPLTNTVSRFSHRLPFLIRNCSFPLN